jgi:hypothetical protein
MLSDDDRRDDFLDFIHLSGLILNGHDSHFPESADAFVAAHYEHLFADGHVLEQLYEHFESGPYEHWAADAELSAGSSLPACEQFVTVSGSDRSYQEPSPWKFDPSGSFEHFSCCFLEKLISQN